MEFQDKKETFQGPYDQYAERKGQAFEILREINIADHDHDGEVLPMYVIRFTFDGEEIEAWPEEIFNDCQCGVFNADLP